MEGLWFQKLLWQMMEMPILLPGADPQSSIMDGVVCTIQKIFVVVVLTYLILRSGGDAGVGF